MTFETSAADLDAIVSVAVRAAPAFRRAPLSDRALWLEALAAALEAGRDELRGIAERETHLSSARLDGEITRTASQLRFFATVVREGSFVEATIDRADAAATPPRPELRRMLRPIGVVAVFAASNFPFAFSVLGNDTASALAAGCPVVVKAHPGHPELSRRTAERATAALAAAGAPAGIFGLVEGMDAGLALVTHPAVSAAGFTGSERGGRALFDLACARPVPIPFYGELGSINPVVVTEAAAAERPGEIAAGFVASFTRDGGQYCTKPGLIFVPAGAGLEDAIGAALGDVAPQRLLTGSIAAAFTRGSVVRSHELALRGLSARVEESEADVAVELAVATVVPLTAAEFLADRERWLEECFGPLSIVVAYANDGELQEAIGALGGSLTASIQHAASDDVRTLSERLSVNAGRVIFNGWPTGVVIGWAQHHGGPYPSTVGSVHSSVGATALRRWLAPIAFQDAPAAALPSELRDDNPLGIPRRLDGVLRPA